MADKICEQEGQPCSELFWRYFRGSTSLPGGAHVVFDYSNPPHTLSPEARVGHERGAASVSALGESWITYFESSELRAKLHSFGFSEIEDLGPRDICSRYLLSSNKGGHILRASTIKCWSTS